MPTGSGTMKNTGECYGHKENESDFWFSGEATLMSMQKPYGCYAVS